MSDSENNEETSPAPSLPARPTIKMGRETPSEPVPVPSSADDKAESTNAPSAPVTADSESDSEVTPTPQDRWDSIFEDPPVAATPAPAADMFDPVDTPGAPVSGDLNALLTDVQKWANENGVSDDPYIAQLSSDLAQRRRLTYWASADPMELLPTPGEEAGRTIRVASRAILLLRNIAVFVPVALTWLAINKATDAFGVYAKTKEGTQVNFLQFWQSGGDAGEILSSFWRIQHIAFVDSLIIGFIILSTLLAGALNGRANGIAARKQRRAELSRTALAISIGRSLHGNRSASPESIGEALALALSDLSEAARNVAVATNRLESSTSSIDALKPRLESLNKQISDLNRHFATDVVNSVSTLSSSVGDLGSTLGKDIQQFISSITTGIIEINEEFARSSTIAQKGVEQLRNDLDVIHSRLAQVAGRRP